MPSIATPIGVNGFSPLPPQTNGQPASETIYTNGIHPYPGTAPGAGGVCLAHVGCLGGVLQPRNMLGESAMCSCGITAGRREFRQGTALPLHGGAWPGTLSRWSCACIPGFLWLILSSFSFLFSSQLKAPRWQTPFSRPTPACSTMQVSNFASHSFPLSPLCSSPLFLGGEHHPRVELGQHIWAWIREGSMRCCALAGTPV